MEYSPLIINTLNLPVLKKAIHGMAAESGMLNFVDPDWEKNFKIIRCIDCTWRSKFPFPKVMLVMWTRPMSEILLILSIPAKSL
ncbi:hypothetical protein TNCT_527491 [Trichonephila clavata]|uniref:Uncharacterized protein n=1 Tax=Trichonephila clavata TaxID=2740835 RepID=A0A8X6H0M0_TRICU|nr:hypothetical protein TNCT_527491 [Trichonephila clavata]